MTRLENITTRNHTNRVRTFVFAACLAAVGLVSCAAVASPAPAPVHTASTLAAR